jgi:predicted Fe-Mo cluster-binding NifX family protein
MTLCIPTNGPLGLNDTVYGHFGSAPYFTVVDTDTNEITIIDNTDKQHGHGNCAPAEDLLARGVDAVAAGGMGRRALARFNAAGIRVFLTRAATPAEAVSEVVRGAAEECTPESACAGHHHGAGQHHL